MVIKCVPRMKFCIRSLSTETYELGLEMATKANNDFFIYPGGSCLKCINKNWMLEQRMLVSTWMFFFSKYKQRLIKQEINLVYLPGPVTEDEHFLGF